MSKWLFTVFVCFSLNQFQAQQILWEKVSGVEFANHKVKDAVTDSKGNIYLVGRYQPGNASFADVDMLRAKTDTAFFYYGTHSFVQKMSPDGEFLDFDFLPGIEASHIVRLTDNRFTICGYMNAEREMNYKGDQRKRVYTIVVDSLLNSSEYKTYPSYYSSTPIGMISDAGGGLTIAATSLAQYEMRYARLIRSTGDGHLIRDTTYQSYLLWFDKNNYRSTVFEPNSLAAGTGSTFWIAGQIKGFNTDFHDSKPMGLIQFDSGLQQMTTCVFGNKEKLPEEEGVFISDASTSEEYVFTVGQDMKSNPNSFAILFDTKGTILYKQPFNGIFLDAPVTASIDDTHWAVLSDNEADEFILSIFDTKGLVKELKFATRKDAKPKALIADNHTVYAFGDIMEGVVWRIWTARIEL